MSPICGSEGKEGEQFSRLANHMDRVSAYLVGVEAVVDEGTDVVQVKRAHLCDSPGGVLKGCQAHVKVDLIQVSAVKSI